VINISQSYTLKATTEPNSVRYRIALPQGNGLGSSERKTIVVSRAHAFVSLCFICTSSCPATIVSPSKWNMLRLFHRHD
jgi:hypothetical protein